MHLYEKKDNSIGVYDLVSDEKVLRDYKEKEMEKIPEKERVYYAVNCIKSGRPYFEQYLKEDFNNLIFSWIYADNDAPIGHDYDDRQVFIPTRNGYLLEQYYRGRYKDKDATRISYPFCMKYYILTDKYYRSYWRGFPQLDNIIQIPKSLFNLQLIENGSYYLLPTNNAEEQLDLFKLNHIDDVSLDEIKKNGIKYRDFDEDKLESDGKVLKLLKK